MVRKTPDVVLYRVYFLANPNVIIKLSLENLGWLCILGKLSGLVDFCVTFSHIRQVNIELDHSVPD